MIPLLYNLKAKRINNYLYKLINVISLSSYSIYLFHMFYIMLINSIYYKLNLKIDYLWIVLVWATTIIGSHFQYHLFEVRITELRNKFGTKKDAIGV
ncbi:hypothetical protein HYN56_01805 [Flavobacterium crocinum]|uniref:Acyltransferase 3 domain-containing protein n=1 Tax=Flavobacterium crocinum TaxID=2183896 RepID=A0A2S1YG42_9FLAO|nr:hypothetical protein HYN56_01805 [Flavobacterium crocinum]